MTPMLITMSNMHQFMKTWTRQSQEGSVEMEISPRTVIDDCLACVALLKASN